MKKILISLIFIILLVPIGYSASILSCAVGGSGTDILGISNLTNAHAELPGQSDYLNRIVCRDTGPAALTIATTGTAFLNLHQATNAHVEKVTETNYEHKAYIGATNGSAEITYRTSACRDTEACIATISTSILRPNSNLHIGDCVTDPYATRVCARLYYNEGTICGGAGVGQADANLQCLGGVCDFASHPDSDLGRCTTPTIKATGKVIDWDTGEAVTSAAVSANLIRGNSIEDTKTTSTDSFGEFEIAFDIEGKEGEIYTINATVTKGDFSTFIVREFLIREGE